MRLRVLDVPIDGLPPELDGLRIAHLSDFHLGVPSRGVRAVERAVAWVEERRPDLVCVTGDLLSRPRGEPRCWRCSSGSGTLRGARQPRSGAVARSVLAAGGAGRLAHGDAALRRVGRGRAARQPVELAGVDPRSWIAQALERLPGSSRRPAHPALPFPERARSGRGRALEPDPRRASARRADRPPVRARQAAARPSELRATQRGSTGGTARRCTSRRASGRHSCRSVSPPGPRRPSSFYDAPACMDGHSHISPDVLARYAADAAAEVRGVHTKQRRGAKVTGRGGRGARRASTTAPTSPPSRPRFSGASPTTSRRWPTPGPTRCTSSSTTCSDRAACRRICRPDQADARDGALGLPRVHLVAVARAAHDRQGPVDGAGRARLRRVRHRLLRRRRARARVDAVRAGAASRARRSCPAGRGPTTRCSSPAPTWSTRRARGCCSRSSSRRSARRATAARGLEAFSYRYREGESATSASGAQDGVPAGLPRRLRLPRVRAAGRSGSPARARRPAAGRRGPREHVLRVVRTPSACRSRCPRRRPSAYAAARSRARDELRDLDRVQRCALAEVVAGEEERESALDRRVAPDPPDEHLVAAGRLARRGEVLDAHATARRRAARAPARRRGRPRSRATPPRRGRPSPARARTSPGSAARAAP